MAIGQDLMAVPFADMLTGIASAIVKAQAELDQNAVTQLVAMYKGLMGDGAAAADNVARLEALGKLATPTFYQFADTEVEVKIAISTTKTTEGGGTAKATIGCVGVDANYSQKYSYSAEGASVIRTRLVPVMAPDKLKALMEALDTQVEAKTLPTPTPDAGKK